MSDDAVTPFRVRGGLHQKLHESAAASGRSVSEEIEWIISEHYRNAQRLPFEMGVITSIAALRTAILRQRWPEKL